MTLELALLFAPGAQNGPATVLDIKQPGHGFTLAPGEFIPVHLDSQTETVILAQANDPNTLASAFLVEVVDADCFRLQFGGLLEVGNHGQARDHLWLDPDTPSNTIGVKPTDVGDFQQLLGQYVSDTEIHIDIEPGFEVLAPAAPLLPDTANTTTGPTAVQPGETWLVSDVAHVITLPDAPADGSTVTLVPQAGPWSNGNYSIVTVNAATTIDAGSPAGLQIYDELDTLLFVYQAATDNWTVSNLSLIHI